MQRISVAHLVMRIFAVTRLIAKRGDTRSGVAEMCVALFYQPEGEEDGRVASGGALAPEPPRTTDSDQSSTDYALFRVVSFEQGSLSPSFFFIFEIGHLLVLKSDLMFLTLG